MATTDFIPHASQSLDIDGLMSLADDLIQVLDTARDISVLTEAHEELSKLKSLVEKDWAEVQTILKDVHGKILLLEEKVEAAEKEGVDDEKLQALCAELENEQRYENQLNQDLRVIEDNMDRLELQRVHIENNKEALNKVKEEEIRAQNEISLYASVTRIIPDLTETDKFMGHIVDREKKIVEKFEFDRAKVSEVEICNRLWKMGNS